jgi:hypothetical protein
MQPDQKGVMVRAVSPVADAARHLQPDDVIMRFDGVQVASDGTVPFRCALHAADLRLHAAGSGCQEPRLSAALQVCMPFLLPVLPCTPLRCVAWMSFQQFRNVGSQGSLSAFVHIGCLPPFAFRLSPCAGPGSASPSGTSYPRSLWGSAPAWRCCGVGRRCSWTSAWPRRSRWCRCTWPAPTPPSSSSQVRNQSSLNPKMQKTFRIQLVMLIVHKPLAQC